MAVATGAYIRGFDSLINGINNSFTKKLLAAEDVAVDVAQKCLTRFAQHQMASEHDPDDKAVADTAEMKATARAYADRNQDGAEVASMGMPWVNRSFRAARSVYADAGINDRGDLYFNMYHTMSYGVYLELANNRRHAVLEPIVREHAPGFLARIKGIYGAG